MFRIFLVLMLVTSTTAQDGTKCSWENCPKLEPDMLNVHMVSHSHDDAGWLKTVDQYYYGFDRGVWLYCQQCAIKKAKAGFSARSDITPAGVQYILDSVTSELERDPRRRFSQCETGFFWRWWQQQTDSRRHQVAKLVNNGQLELVNGGWVQNDEAGTHYVAIVDQMTLGLEKLNQTFGRCARPRIGWQLDPFGHSREMGNLFAQMGMEAVFFWRLHYLEKEGLIRNRSMEMIWHTSNEDPKSKLLVGVLYYGYYPPSGFCFDNLCGGTPIMDDPRLEGYNKDQMVDKFLASVDTMTSSYRTNNVMIMNGGDFQYTAANWWYKNLDKLIEHANERQARGSKVNLVYSTPSCYLDAVMRSLPAEGLDNKTGDFFPYGSSSHQYWTGYFTSRPTFKGFIRQLSGLLQTCKQLDTHAYLGPTDMGDIEVLKRSVALNQHHDAVTGTAKQHVTNDYSKRLYKGMMEGQQIINDALQVLMPKGSKTEKIPQQTFCPLINVTVCNVSQSSTKFSFIVFNGMSQTLNSFVRIPYSARGVTVVSGLDGNGIMAQVSKTFMVPKQLPYVTAAAYEVIVPVSVGPQGYSTYFVSSSESRTSRRFPPRLTTVRDRLKLSNDHLSVHFDEATGRVSHIHDKASGRQLPFNQNFYWYKGGVEPTPSGAYIFRPNGTARPITASKVITSRVTGPLVDEMRQIFNPWVSQVIRTYKDKPYVEFEWTVGPIPHKDNIGREIITRFETNVKSNGYFYTDANGRQIMERRRNFQPTYQYSNTEPVSANYFPVNSRIFIKGFQDNNTQFTVLSDRSQGGSSLQDGNIELMISFGFVCQLST